MARYLLALLVVGICCQGCVTSELWDMPPVRLDHPYRSTVEDIALVPVSCWPVAWRVSLTPLAVATDLTVGAAIGAAFILAENPCFAAELVHCAFN